MIRNHNPEQSDTEESTESVTNCTENHRLERLDKESPMLDKFILSTTRKLELIDKDITELFHGLELSEDATVISKSTKSTSIRQIFSDRLIIRHQLLKELLLPKLSSKSFTLLHMERIMSIDFPRLFKLSNKLTRRKHLQHLLRDLLMLKLS
jgi:hypothetical protein